MESQQHLSQTDLYFGGDSITEHGYVMDAWIDWSSKETANDETLEDRQPEIPTLTVIVRVNRNDFWMTSDGEHARPSTVWKDLAEVKLTCAVCSPEPRTSNLELAVFAT